MLEADVVAFGQNHVLFPLCFVLQTHILNDQSDDVNEEMSSQ